MCGMRCAVPTVWRALDISCRAFSVSVITELQHGHRCIAEPKQVDTQGQERLVHGGRSVRAYGRGCMSHEGDALLIGQRLLDRFPRK